MKPCTACGFHHLPEVGQCADRLAALAALFDPGQSPIIGTHREMSYPPGRLTV